MSKLRALDLTDPRLREAAELLHDLTDGEAKNPCEFDHHGFCQMHDWFETEPSCPIPRARDLLKRLEWDCEGAA